MCLPVYELLTVLFTSTSRGVATGVESTSSRASSPSIFPSPVSPAFLAVLSTAGTSISGSASRGFLRGAKVEAEWVAGGDMKGSFLDITRRGR